MSLKLNEIQIDPPPAVRNINSAEKQQRAKDVKSLGLIAFILAVAGIFIPVVGLFMLIGAWLLSRSALKTSDDYLISEEDDKFARWASTISKVFLVLGALGLILFILTSL
jgi:hypothetical protein